MIVVAFGLNTIQSALFSNFSLTVEGYTFEMNLKDRIRKRTRYGDRVEEAGNSDIVRYRDLQSRFNEAKYSKVQN